MRANLRRRSAATEPAADEGPFVSFTDLIIGILFLFLILVAALMLMHFEAMARAKAEQERLQEQIRVLQAQLDEIMRQNANRTPFRLAIVYNSFQRPSGSQNEWKYTRTVQVFRGPNDVCLENVVLRNNLNLAWKPAVEAQNIPTPGDQDAARKGAPCALSASGERWNSETETGGVQRVAANLYRGVTVLHTKDGDKSIDIEYRVLGVYDDAYRSSGGGRKFEPAPPPPSGEQKKTGTFSLQ